MKSILLTLVFMVAGMGMQNVSAAPVEKEIYIAIQDALVPEFGDRSIDTKVTISGQLPNSCYRWSKSEVRHENETMHIVRAQAFVTTNVMCLMFIKGYTKEVNLGRLRAGDHVIRFQNGDDTAFQRKLTVQ